MLSALNRYNQWVTGVDIKPTGGPFSCPNCGEQVFFRMPKDRVWHFYHQSHQRCGYENEESPIHYDCKVKMYRSLCMHPKVSYCMPEYTIRKRRADIYAVINNYPVAIEIQNSDISRQEIQAKFEVYTAASVSCLYLLPHSLPQGDLQAVEWKRYLHAMYMQNLYYWSPSGILQDSQIVMDNARVRIVHLANYKNYPIPGFWTEKHWVQPRPVIDNMQSVSICDFAPLMRHHDDIMSRYLGITDAMLWHHQLGDWWNNISDFGWQVSRLSIAE
jgi:competence CoiA-like predicted nuclease